MHKNLKNKFILNFILFGCIIVISIISGIILDNITDYNEQLKHTIEINNRRTLKNNLKKVETDLTNDIKNGKINLWDDNEINNWFKQNLKTTINYKNITIVNLGYSYQEYDEYNFRALKEKYKLKDEQLIKEIKDKCKNYYPTQMDNNQINKEIIAMSRELSNKYNIPKVDISELLRYLFFIKENILFESPNLVIPDNEFYNKFKKEYSGNSNITVKSKDGNTEWVEYAMIPDGKLGFGNEAPYLNGHQNMSYKKILIIVSLDATHIMEPYTDLIRKVEQLRNLIYILLGIFVMLSTIIMCYKLTELGGDVSGIDCDRYNCDDFDELANIILKNIERVRKRQN